MDPDNIIDRTTINFEESLLYEDVTEKYFPYLDKNIADSSVGFTFEGKGGITEGGRKQGINKLTGIIRTKKVMHLQMDFKGAYVGEYTDTNDDAWAFNGFSFFTTPGYEVSELPKDEIALIDNIRDLTTKFFE